MMIIISSNFIFSFTNFCFIASFLTKLLTLGILFLTAVKTVVVAKLVISGILSSIFFILALYASLLTRLLLLYLLVYFKSTGTGTNLSTSNLSILYFKLLKLVCTFSNLSISNLSTL